MPRYSEENNCRALYRAAPSIPVSHRFSEPLRKLGRLLPATDFLRQRQKGLGEVCPSLARFRHGGLRLVKLLVSVEATAPARSNNSHRSVIGKRSALVSMAT